MEALDIFATKLTILIILIIVTYIAFLGLLFSIACFVYAKSRGYKRPGLAFLPLYKHIYFEKFGYGMMPAHVPYNALPGVTLALLALVIGAAFISSFAFIGALILFLFYRWGLFKAFYAGHGCKAVGVMSFFSLFGLAIFFILYTAFKKNNISGSSEINKIARRKNIKKIGE